MRGRRPEHDRYPILIQAAVHSDAPWVTVDRTATPREGAGRSQVLAKSGKYPHVRVIDVRGHVRIEYENGVRIDRRPQTPGGEEYRDRQTRLAERAQRRDDHIASLRPAPVTAWPRTVVVNGVEFESIWDGRGPLPGARLGDWP